MSVREQLTAEIKAGRSKFSTIMFGTPIEFKLPTFEKHYKDEENEKRAAAEADKLLLILAS